MADPQQDLVRAMGAEAAKAAPPAVVTAYAAISTNLPVLVGIATLIYIVIQAAHLIWRWWCQVHDRRAALRAHREPPPIEDAL